MPRPRASVPTEAIRIEDEVWQEAFTRREPARPRPERRLHAIDGGRARATPATNERRPAPPPAAPRARSERPPAGAPRTAAAQRPSPAAPEARPAAPAASQATAGGVAGRRTVTIRGYGAERNLPWPDGSSRRPQRRLHERSGFRPDRVAMWAVMLGILLVIVAVASPH
jgi:hypothetical protein